MSIPKAFMLCPMGHPDKFLRATNRSLAFHSRSDVPDVSFETFFQQAKFSLWWLPEVNNMCRLRSQPGLPDALVGNRGALKGAASAPQGLIVSFQLSENISDSQVALTELELAPTTNIIAVASPDFPGAFRFECAFHKGHFLTFDPPTNTRMMKNADQFGVVDFVLMDFANSQKFRTLDEVLVPVVKSMSGDRDFIKLGRICQDSRVSAYFTQVMGKTWDFTDFELYFHAHSDRWEYDSSQQSVKMRKAEDKIFLQLRRVKTVDEATSLLMSGDLDERELSKMPLEAVEGSLQQFAEKGGSLESHRLAESKVLKAFQDGCLYLPPSSFQRLVAIWSILSKAGKLGIKPDHAELRAATQETCRRAVERFLGSGDTVVDMKALETLLEMPLDWATGSTVLKKVQQLLAPISLGDLVPLMKKAATAKAGKLAECLATAVTMKTAGAVPVLVVDALDAMVAGGFGIEGAARTLRTLVGQAPLDSCARVIAGITRQKASGPDFEACWKAILEEGILEKVPPAALSQLAASTMLSSASAVPAMALSAINSVVQKGLASGAWGCDDVIGLAAAVCAPEGSWRSSRDRDQLLSCLAEYLQKKLADLTNLQLVKLQIGIIKEKACRSLLETSMDELPKRFDKCTPADLLSLTKGLLPLGRDDACWQKVSDCWQKKLLDDAEKMKKALDNAENVPQPGDTVEIFGLTSEAGQKMNGCKGNVVRLNQEKGRYELKLAGGFTSAEAVSIHPKNLKKIKSSGIKPKRIIIPDDVGAAKLAELLGIFASASGDRAVAELLAERLIRQVAVLTAETMSSLEKSLGNSSDFRNRSELLQALRKARQPADDDNRDRGGGRRRSRSRGREDRRSRSRGRNDRSRSRGRYDRSRSRGRRSRSRGRRSPPRRSPYRGGYRGRGSPRRSPMRRSRSRRRR
eukprot:TRINITY_DN1039_c1_g1_i1.p1 TRINITY_DN1039_c1_g1~~TRINITY_DN1039_c1_g1_i1.p1  ORF type:complete len:953 (+),score=146.15 TRINITY_DN1039_c1_g1_i1:105-2861(+)